MWRDLTTLEKQLEAAEGQMPYLREGCAKSVVWAGKAQVQTPLSLVFLHGFSASCGELRPLPELVADALGANIFFTRLMGHGQDGAAMGDATLAGWRADVDEALEIGVTLGKRVIVMGCSTGCTLAVDALARGLGDQVAGCCFVSPNFGLRNKMGQMMLDLPGSTRWAPYLIGKERSFPVLNDGHGQFWTTTYPTQAVGPMAEVVRVVRHADLGQISTPLLMALNPDDQVISPQKAEDVMARWGGPTDKITLKQTPEDDDMGHVMAGDVFSPGQTNPLADKIILWAKNL